MARSSVDLPAPFGPMIVVMLPLGDGDGEVDHDGLVGVADREMVDLQDGISRIA